MKNLIKILFFTLLLASPAWASQNSTTLSTSSPYPGLTMLNDINSAFNSFQTNFSGASAPPSPATWQTWEDTTNSLLKIYNGSTWLILGSTGGGVFTPFSSGKQDTAVVSTGSSNAYVVTYSPAVTALVVGETYSFISSFVNTTAATLTVNGLGPYAITKNGTSSVQSGDIPNGGVVVTIWDGTRFQMTGQLGNGIVGTVTSVDISGGSTGLTFTGGPITNSGTFTANGTLAVANGGTGNTSYSAHQALVATGATTLTPKTIPNCADSTGQHLNYTQSTDSFSCGVTSSYGMPSPFGVGATLYAIIEPFSAPGGVPNYYPPLCPSPYNNLAAGTMWNGANLSPYLMNGSTTFNATYALTGIWEQMQNSMFCSFISGYGYIVNGVLLFQRVS